MSQQWLTQKRLMIAIVLGLFATSLLPSRTVTVFTSTPNQILTAAVEPPIWLADRLSPDLREAQTQPLVNNASKQRLQRELGNALSQIRNLENQLRQQRRQIHQLQQTQVRTDRTVTMVGARVISVSASSKKPALTIDRGRQSGVAQGQAVMYAGNLVGQVELVGPVTATVRLLTAAGTALQLNIQPPAPPRASESQKRIHVRAELNAAQDAFIAEPAKDKPVQVGDLAHLDDDRWPPEAQGAIVGKVVEVSGHPQRPLLISQVRIEPLPPLKQLDRVSVLVPRRRSRPVQRRGK